MMWRPGTVGLADPPRTPQTPQSDEATLHAAGWDDDAVRRLQALREAYPAMEYVLTMPLLRFAKWRYDHNDQRMREDT